jgi:hypothetical protein
MCASLQFRLNQGSAIPFIRAPFKTFLGSSSHSFKDRKIKVLLLQQIKVRNIKEGTLRAGHNSLIQGWEIYGPQKLR